MVSPTHQVDGFYCQAAMQDYEMMMWLQVIGCPEVGLSPIVQKCTKQKAKNLLIRGKRESPLDTDAGP